MPANCRQARTAGCSTSSADLTSAHHGRQRNDRIRLRRGRSHDPLVPGIAVDDLEAVVEAAVEQCRLPEEQIVDHRDLVSGGQEGRRQDGSNVPSAAGDENAQPDVSVIYFCSLIAAIARTATSSSSDMSGGIVSTAASAYHEPPNR